MLRPQAERGMRSSAFNSSTLAQFLLLCHVLEACCLFLPSLLQMRRTVSLKMAGLPVPPLLQQRRVVITGMGMVSPLGIGKDATWQALLAGKCAVKALETPALRAFPAQVAAFIRRGKGEGEFDVGRYVDKADLRTQSVDFIAFAMASAQEALQDAGLLGKDGGSSKAQQQHLGPYDRDRFGVAIGSGIGSIEEIGDVARTLYGGAGAAGTAADKAAALLASIEQGQRKVSPFFVPRILINMAAGNVSIKYGLRGPNHAVSTACATGAHAIGDAFRFIKNGSADVMLAGGTEASVTPMSLAGFTRAKALATAFNDRPEAASRPFDSGRDGFVLGEGCAVLVLEEMQSALRRGAPIYAEVRGYGLCGDAHHITSPAEDGSGAYRCMAAALSEGGIPPSLVDYVNAHATSTPVGDVIEGYGLGRLFGSEKVMALGREKQWTSIPSVQAQVQQGQAAERKEKVLVSSTKGAVGHLLGAAGAIEVAFSALAVKTGQVPPTLNLEHPSPELPDDVCDFNTEAVQRPIAAALSNSFGFGGTNCSILVTQADSSA